MSTLIANLAAMLLKLDQPQEAIDPADSLARVNLAIVVMESGDIDRARAVIEEALASSPGNARAYNASGDIYQRCRDVRTSKYRVHPSARDRE